MIKLFVVGYPPEMQEVELIELFVLYGTIHRIDMIMDKVSHKSLGYCFIEMVDQTDADRAVNAIDGTIVKGRKITVKLARQRSVVKNKTTTKQYHFNVAGTHNKVEKGDAPNFKPKSKRPRKSMIQSKDDKE